MAIIDSREEIISKRGYGENIAGDQYSLYLSNYPVTATYLAERIKGKGNIIAELCCGIGVTLSALAGKFDRLIGVELDETILKYCKQNLKQTGHLNKVTLVKADVAECATIKNIKADIVIYDIPYWVSRKLPDGSNVLDHNPDLKELVQNIRTFITSNIIIFAPPYLEYEEVKRQLGECEFEKVYINGEYDRNHIYFGGLVQTEGVTEIKLGY